MPVPAEVPAGFHGAGRTGWSVNNKGVRQLWRDNVFQTTDQNGTKRSADLLSGSSHVGRYTRSDQAPGEAAPLAYRHLSMFVYGVCAGPTGKVDRFARPSIDNARSPEDQTLVLFDQPSISIAYNHILGEAQQHEDLEGVILMHDDVEILDPLFREKLQRAFADGSVGVVGVVGARRVSSLEWWNYEPKGRVREDRAGMVDFGGGEHDVDMVDGLLLALSPWVARNLRFDEGYVGFHGYDAEICFSAKAHGRRVVVQEIDVLHRTQGGYGDKGAFDEADLRFQRKWGLTPPKPPHPVRRLYIRVAERLSSRRRPPG
jgi:hypothetical protein